MKPWDKFASPITDRVIMGSGGLWNEPLKKKMQELEKRLELTERLLDDYLSRDENDDYLTEEAEEYFKAIK